MRPLPTTALQNATAASPFTVVLAGGDGVRLQTLTRAIYGHSVPKQFAQLAGDASMLHETVERAHRISDAKRIVVVVNHQHLAMAQQQLEAFPRVQLVEQPFNAGTALGIGQALRTVLAQDKDATVCFLPSDHYFDEPDVFMEHVRALAYASHDSALTLVGVKAERPEPELGWIVPGKVLETINGRWLAEVESFHEKPTDNQLQRLLAKGALRNTFVMAGKARSFWKAIEHHLPEHADAFEFASRTSAPWARAAAIQAYRTLPPANFSVEVLQKWKAVRVFDVPDCGWSDWGTPERVFASLKGKPAFYRLQARLTDGVRSMYPQVNSRARLS